MPSLPFKYYKGSSTITRDCPPLPSNITRAIVDRARSLELVVREVSGDAERADEVDGVLETREAEVLAREALERAGDHEGAAACRHRNWSVKIRGAGGTGSRSEARQCEFALVV